MTATEELRRLLDERGVEWWQSANTLGCIFTRWYSPLFGDEVVAMENGEEGLVLFDHFMTPEQAVEATLGRGTCRMERDNAWSSDYEWHCTECGEHVSTCNEPPRFCPSCGREVVSE